MLVWAGCRAPELPFRASLTMGNEDAIEFDGMIKEVLSGGTFKVDVGEGHTVMLLFSAPPAAH